MPFVYLNPAPARRAARPLGRLSACSPGKKCCDKCARGMGDYCLFDTRTAGRVCYGGDPPPEVIAAQGGPSLAAQAAATAAQPPRGAGWWPHRQQHVQALAAPAENGINMSRAVRPSRQPEIIPPGAAPAPASVAEAVATAQTATTNAVQSVGEFLNGSNLITGVPNWGVLLGAGALVLMFRRRA